MTLRTIKHNRPIRGAFTLVELLVAMALCIFIMWLLAECFKLGLDFTRHARSTGSMMSQLDGARAVIARDLLAEHFLPEPDIQNGGVRLSDRRYDKLDNFGQGFGGYPVWSPPKGGFFRIISSTPGTVLSDPDGYSMNTAVNHALHFTSILPASEQQRYSVNVLVGGVSKTFESRAAEIGLFLVDSGKRTTPGPSGQPLYYLIRRQRLTAMTADDISTLAPAVADSDVITSNGSTAIYTLSDLMNPGPPVTPVAVRLPISPSTLPGGANAALAPTFGINNGRYGEDMLLDNVLSFEVMVDWAPSAVTGSTFGPRTTAVGNWDSPFDTLYYAGGNAGKNPTFTNAGVFDTWMSAAPPSPFSNWNNFALANNQYALPLAIRVKQIQITTRIWDSKTRQGRQSTWKFAM